MSGMAGRLILVTRPEGRDDALLDRVLAGGARIEHRPSIVFEPPEDPGPAEKAILKLDTFQWLVLTSRTGVRFFIDRLRTAEDRRLPETVRVAVVGPGTAGAAREAGLRPDLVASRSSSEGLAEELAGRACPGEKVLWVKPESDGPSPPPVLETVGVTVLPVAFYRTFAAPACREIAADLVGGAYDGALFTSPSTFRSVFDAVPSSDRDRLRQVVKVAIGKSTAAAMEATGYPAEAIAEQPTAEGVAEAFETAFGTSPLC
jgi:uroporphyrinogen III methyltransferase/synthase